jgi:hypothetical protein
LADSAGPDLGLAHRIVVDQFVEVIIHRL